MKKIKLSKQGRAFLKLAKSIFKVNDSKLRTEILKNLQLYVVEMTKENLGL
jgi:hypothetical protein